MAPWLNERDLLERLNISRIDLVFLIFDGELKAYKKGSGFKPIDIARKSKEQVEAEIKEWNERCSLPMEKALCQKRLDEKDRCFLTGPRHIEQVARWLAGSRKQDDHSPNLPEKCLDGILYYPCHSRWMEDNFLVSAGGRGLIIEDRVSRLISILEDVGSNIMIQYKALEALLPVLLFKLNDLETWEERNPERHNVSLESLVRAMEMEEAGPPKKQYPGRINGDRNEPVEAYIKRRRNDKPPASDENLVYELRGEMAQQDIGKLLKLGVDKGQYLKNKVQKMFTEEATRLGTADEIIRGRKKQP